MRVPGSVERKGTGLSALSRSPSLSFPRSCVFAAHLDANVQVPCVVHSTGDVGHIFSDADDETGGTLQRARSQSDPKDERRYGRSSHMSKGPEYRGSRDSPGLSSLTPALTHPSYPSSSRSLPTLLLVIFFPSASPSPLPTLNPPRLLSSFPVRFPFPLPLSHGGLSTKQDFFISASIMAPGATDDSCKLILVRSEKVDEQKRQQIALAQDGTFKGPVVKRLLSSIEYLRERIASTRGAAP